VLSTGKADCIRQVASNVIFFVAEAAPGPQSDCCSSAIHGGNSHRAGILRFTHYRREQREKPPQQAHPAFRHGI